MKKFVLIILVAGLVLTSGILNAVTGVYNETVQIVNSSGVVQDPGTASATSASYNATVRVVNSTGLVVDSFGANLAAPGPIGGTTSSTGQFTNLSVGASVPALDGTTGDITANTAICAGGSGNVNCPGEGVGKIDTATSTGGGELDFGNGAMGIVGTTAGTGSFTFSGGSVAITAGHLISTTGGVAPTVTCSGGSTGTSVAAGSTNNRGQIVSSSSASTNCTITWSAAATWPQAPFCVFVDGGASITPITYSTGACGTSTCIVDFASTTSKTINYMCM